MKNTKRSAFTIVELVIVIAVIAILSAVLIPTFGSIIESANKAVDTQLVANINTVLAIEDVLGGGVNDAVEIQKVVKENGLKLQTKSKGQYIWYDIENKKVVLGGLDENGIVLDSEEPTAAVDANGPALISDTNVVTEIPKGQYKAAISPENFVEGYLFLSTDSADNLADAIHTLRNPKGDTKEEIIESLTDTLADLTKIKGNVSGGTQVAALMQDFMNQTAIMTEKGTVYVGNGDNTSVTKVLVSSGMNKITAESLNDLSTTFPQLYIVDLPSTVVDITDVDGVITAGKIEDGNVNGIYFVYCNDEIKRIDNNNGDIANLISVEQRGQAITTLQIVKVYLNKDASAPSGKDNIIIKTVEYKTGDEYIDGYYKHVVAYTFTDLGIENNADSVYEFKKYSFYTYSNPNSIEIGTTNYIINEDEQMLIKNGILTVYAYYQELDADYKINGKCYSSAQVTGMLADNALLPEGATAITVISTTAKLDATLIGEESAELKIPSTVTLWVPCTKTEYTRESSGLHKPYYDGSATKPYALYDADNNATGVFQLEIASNVELTNEGYLTVDAQLYCQGDSAHFGFILDNSGILVANGKIINKGRLEAYGVIKTKVNGEIIAKSGSTVLERMAFLDLHGGNNTMASITKNISPFNHFTVDSIRLPLTIEVGATYSTYGLMSTALGTNTLEFKIAGTTNTPDQKSNSNPLFNMLPDSKVVKTYDKNEGIHLAIYGNVEDSKKKLDVEGIEIDFTKIPLPLPNFDITIMNGATLSLARATYKVLPGSDIVVEEGGTFNINCNVVVYDSFVLDGNGKTVIKPRIYNTANGNAFTKSNATFTVKGTLVLQEKAQFAGTIIGDSNDQFTTNTIKSTIVIKPGAKTSCNQIKEGGGGKYYVIYSTINEYTVKDFDWKGKWQTGLLEDGTPKYEQITQNAGTTDITYEYTGGIWTTP